MYIYGLVWTVYLFLTKQFLRNSTLRLSRLYGRINVLNTNTYFSRLWVTKIISIVDSLSVDVTVLPSPIETIFFICLEHR